MTTTTAIVPGTKVDNCYQIERVLGQGGFGRTYLALNTKRFDEPCVLKEFVTPVADEVTAHKCRELFRREAETLYKLNHPQIPKFLAWFEDSGRLFIVQEYVNGKSYHELLRDRLKQTQEPFTEPEVMAWLQAMLPVLQYLHGRNIVHRDIAPDNIMLPHGQSLPVLIDFGVVKQVMEGSFDVHSRIHGSLTVGKLGYAPPEQIRTAQCSPSGDLYSLAATAVVLLTGRQPDQLFDSHELEWQWRSYTQVGDHLAAVLDRMLADKPKSRYASAQAVLEALIPNLTSFSSPTNPVPSAEAATPLVSPSQSHPSQPDLTPSQPNHDIDSVQTHSVQDSPVQTGRSHSEDSRSMQPSQASGIISSTSDFGTTSASPAQKEKEHDSRSLSPRLPNELNLIAEPILKLAQEQFTGRLTIRSAQQSWSLFYCIGRLSWATSSYLPNRRFLRLFQMCYGVQPSTLDLQEGKLPDPVHYHVMVTFSKRNTLASAKMSTTLVRAMLGEVLFDLFQSTAPETFIHTTEPNVGIDKTSTLMSAIVRPENAIALAAESWTQWQKAGLTGCCPDHAPLIRYPEQLKQHVTQPTYSTLAKVIDGNRTLREIALTLKQNLRQLSLSLLPYLRQGTIGLQKVSDVTFPFSVSKVTSKPETLLQPAGPLIACIDDSPHICEIMKAILEANGYQCLGIQDSLRAISALITNKPALVFLDLVMPVANGYEICSQIRRVSTLKKIPVIILTGNDGVVDRIRANMVGATDFLSKPIDEKKLLKVLQQHCPVK